MSTDSTANRPPLTLSTNILYGVGSVAFGVQITTLSSILMLFYNQVVGLPAAWVGAAMAGMLIFDAICDPLIGEWSDHTRSRWGRRHPFMYASALPAAAGFYFLFNPPRGWSQNHLLIYLAVTLMLVRILVSLYEVPSTALGPELTLDYDQRTSLMGSRFFFGTLGGAGMSFLALQVFLRKDATHPLGILNRAGYADTALVAAIVIFFSIMISCVGTHRFIAGLVHGPAVRSTWRERFKEVSGTLTNRSFLALTASALAGAISTGLRQSLDFYISAYFFELTPAQMSYLALAFLFAAFAGVIIAPVVSRWFGKKWAMIGVFFASLFASAWPVGGRLAGLMPANGTHALFVTVLLFTFLAATLGLTGFIIVTSMMADVVEDAAVTTGQRSEGLLFAANGLINKCVTGVGTLLAGLILAWISFPQHATPGQVDPTILYHLGIVFVPTVTILGAISITVLMLYKIDRSTHERNVEQLAGAAQTALNPAAEAEMANDEQSRIRASV